MPHRAKTVPVERRRDGGQERVSDLVAIEEPLEIRLRDTALAVIMRTPGDDEDLATGFFITEGILHGPHEIAAFEHPGDSRIGVRLADGVEVDPTRFQRNLFVSSSCGVCGKASIETVQVFARPAPPFHIRSDLLATLTDRLRDSQPTFDETGGLHAAGLFELAGQPLAVREDVGRHNAVDKAIGAAARRGWPLPPAALVVSGRQSFEIVQKAAVAGIGAVIGVSAPSSLAVELAESLGMLLVGFSRGRRYNVYAGRDRIAPTTPSPGLA
jgi:FdhD protein